MPTENRPSLSTPAGLAVEAPVGYEPPRIVELGTLRDLTAAGSFCLEPENP
jgi:hypothetical protein